MSWRSATIWAVSSREPHPDGQQRAVIARLVAGSAVMLFLELALIRWLGANVVHLSYFSNFVLLGSFLGIGLGFLISGRRWSVWPASLPLLAILVVAVRAFPVTIERRGVDLIYFTAMAVEGPPAWLALPVVFVLVALILAGPAELVGECFARLRPLTAYRWDLIGSLTGIACFTAVSFARAPSFVWGTVVGLVLVDLAGTPRRRVVGAASALVVVTTLVLESMAPGITWSPYYKVSTRPIPGYDSRFLQIDANGVPHQMMAPAQWRLDLGETIYSSPYQRIVDNPLRNVLIVGAGSGSDVAIARVKGAAHIDAVDIDPRILQIGLQDNPDRAYDNRPGEQRVTRHTNDGRAFLENTDTRYDLILFALPDSLTLVSGASQIRLESFLFTSEAMASVRDHLSDSGAFAMYNYYREDWLIDRLAGTAQQAFGHAPCVDTFDGRQAVVTIARDPTHQLCATEYSPAGDVVAPATDNAPFLYFRGGGFPRLYLLTLAGILAISLIGVRLVGGPLGAMRPYADLFFMGAAFLLLETKNVAGFALLFGTTWLVNALVFAGVLVTVLAAVETTRRIRTPPLPAIYAAIAAGLALAWMVQPAMLLGLSFVPRLLAAIALAFIPIFLANVAFAKRFADSRSAFGVNLLGAIVGGCLEYAALLTGYNNLLIVTGVLYLLAFLLVPRRT
jgi:hypothetical protein